MLSISNLHVTVGDKPILKGLTLDVNGAHQDVLCYAGVRRPS